MGGDDHDDEEEETGESVGLALTEACGSCGPLLALTCPDRSKGASLAAATSLEGALLSALVPCQPSQTTGAGPSHFWTASPCPRGPLCGDPVLFGTAGAEPGQRLCTLAALSCALCRGSGALLAIGGNSNMLGLWWITVPPSAITDMVTQSGLSGRCQGWGMLWLLMGRGRKGMGAWTFEEPRFFSGAVGEEEEEQVPFFSKSIDVGNKGELSGASVRLTLKGCNRGCQTGQSSGNNTCEMC